MRFQVPQFIGVEDKIFGPFTLKQFIYVVGGGASGFLAYKFLPKIAAFPVIIIVVGFALLLAFKQVNNKPFVFFIENAVRFFVGPKLYIWKKAEKKPVAAASLEKGPGEPLLYVPKLADSRLKDLTWSLDVKESLNPVTKDDKKSLYERQYESAMRKD